MKHINQVLAMEYAKQDEYYSELKKSVGELLSLGLKVVPALNIAVDRDDYSGLNEYRDLRDSGELAGVEMEQFGLESDCIQGEWSEDGMTMNGFSQPLLEKMESMKSWEDTISLMLMNCMNR